MKLQHYFFFLFLLLPALVVAQQEMAVKVSYERSPKGDVTFYAESDSYVPYTVSLSFSKLTNSSYQVGMIHQTPVGHGRTRLLTLRPTTENTPIGFSYRYTYKKGNSRLETDTNYVYLFPMPEGKIVRLNYMMSINKVLGKEDKKRVNGLGFFTTAGDTICASRGGLVTEVVDNSASTSENTDFQATENYVEVYHKDGTFLRYKLFRNNGIFVSPGDNVVPGQPLGVIGGENYKQGSHLRYTIFCPDLESHFYIPDFYLSPEEVGKPVAHKMYKSWHPVEIITREMSKKQKQKFVSEE